jgi:ribosome maturation factor RimP
VSVEADVRAAVARAISGSEIELVGVGVSGSGRGRVVRVTIDKPGGVTVDDCAAASRAVSRVLDAEDPIDGPYRLEVESPGLERPLRDPADFARAVGAAIRVKVAGASPVQGRLAAAHGGEITIETGDGPVAIRISEIVRARTVLEWAGDAKGRQS